MPKINKRIVEAAKARNTAYDINDSELRGFGIRILPSGAHSYFVRYRRGGQRRRISLGSHGTLIPEQARARAIQLLARVGAGEDPAASRQSGGHIITVADLRQALRRGTHHGPSQAEVGGRIPQQPSALHRAGAGPVHKQPMWREPTSPNSTTISGIPVTKPIDSLALLSKMFNLAEMWGLRPGRLQPVPARQEIPGGKAKALPEQ